MVISKQNKLPPIKSEQYVDVTLVGHQLGFASHLAIYVSQHVWDQYMVWAYSDDQFFNVQQLQVERQAKILKDALNLLSACNKELPDEELFFNRHIVVRKEHLTEQPELVLFKLHTACDENDKNCLIIDAVNIFQRHLSQEIIWEYQFLSDLVERVLCVHDDLSDNMQILEDLLEKDEDSLKSWLTMNNEQEHPFMIVSANKVIKLLYQYFDDKGDFSQNENVLFALKKILNS